MGLSGDTSSRSRRRAAADSETLKKVQPRRPTPTPTTTPSPVDKKDSKFEGAAVSRNREGQSGSKRVGCSVCRETMTTTTTTTSTSIGARCDDKPTTPLKPFFNVVRSTYPATSMDNDVLFQRWKRRQKSVRNSDVRLMSLLCPNTNQDPILQRIFSVKFYCTLEFNQSQSFKKVTWFLFLVNFKRRVKFYAEFCF